MMGDPLDMKQIFFTNLQLLGLDATAKGMDNKIPFNKNMFDLPNKTGSEVVLHFLFEKLNPVMCREEFRHCWPIVDKQQEAQFRRTCNNWLNNISKNEPDAHLPRITGSLFLSPGGEKFIQLLLHFSRYVLQHEIERMVGKEKDYLRYPELTQQTTSLSQAKGNAAQCSMVRNRKLLLEESQIILSLNREWKEYTNELVKDYRKLSKSAREKDHKIREEIQKATERGAARGSPMVRKRRSTNAYEYDFDPQSIKRAQRVQEVRDLWKQFDDFCNREASEREVIESIVDKTLNKYKINASDVNIKVPDLLLTECEDEIRKRHVDSNFHHGKLNLVSIIQLWNLCLHLYVEKLHQAGVPKFDAEVKAVKDRVHTSHAYLANTQALKEQVASILPDLKESIDYLRDKIEQEVTISTTPHSLRTTSVGLGLMEPSPPVSFTPKKTDSTPEEAAMKLTPDDVSTPEAVAKISDDITGTIRKNPNTLFQGTPMYAGSVKRDTQKAGRVTSKLPKKTKTEDSSSRTVDIRGQLHSTPTRMTTTRQMINHQDMDGIIQQPETLASQLIYLPTKNEESFNNRSMNKSNITQSSGTVTPKLSPRSATGSLTPKNQSYSSPVITPRQAPRSPSDLIADEVMGLGPVMTPGVSGAEAFQTRTEIPRSPIGMEVKMMFREAMSNDNSPRSDHSRSFKSQRSADHSLNLSNESSRSKQGNLSKEKQEMQGSLHRSFNTSVSSHRSAFEPIDLNNQNSYDAIYDNSKLKIDSNKGGVGSELELLNGFNVEESNLEYQSPRPKSPVGEILDQLETDQEDNSLFSKQVPSENSAKRPPSPVAEILESIESEKEENIQDTNQTGNSGIFTSKQSERESYLQRPTSPVAELLDSFESEPEENNKNHEEDEFYLEQPEDLQTSEAEDDIAYEFLAMKREEQRVIISTEVLPQSPLKDEIRRMYKEAVLEDSPLSGRLDLRGAGDGLDDIEMPDMPLDDSFGEYYSESDNRRSNKASRSEVFGKDLMSFGTPKQDINLFQSYDARKLEEAKHELDEIFSQSLPLRIGHVLKEEAKYELKQNKAQLEQLEKSIGEIQGELLELSSNSLLNRDTKDDSDLFDNLDDSFAPLKDGFLVEGGTPVTPRSNQTKQLPKNSDNDIRQRMQQLKEAASRIKSNYMK